jgi:hypothetical protein
MGFLTPSAMHIYSPWGIVLLLNQIPPEKLIPGGKRKKIGWK